MPAWRSRPGGTSTARSRRSGPRASPRPSPSPAGSTRPTGPVEDRIQNLDAPPTVLDAYRFLYEAVTEAEPPGDPSPETLAIWEDCLLAARQRAIEGNRGHVHARRRPRQPAASGRPQAAGRRPQARGTSPARASTPGSPPSVTWPTDPETVRPAASVSSGHSGLSSRPAVSAWSPSSACSSPSSASSASAGPCCWRSQPSSAASSCVGRSGPSHPAGIRARRHAAARGLSESFARSRVPSRVPCVGRLSEKWLRNTRNYFLRKPSRSAHRPPRQAAAGRRRRRPRSPGCRSHRGRRLTDSDHRRPPDRLKAVWLKMPTAPGNDCDIRHKCPNFPAPSQAGGVRPDGGVRHRPGRLHELGGDRLPGRQGRRRLAGRGRLLARGARRRHGRNLDRPVAPLPGADRHRLVDARCRPARHEPRRRAAARGDRRVHVLGGPDRRRRRQRSLRAGDHPDPPADRPGPPGRAS